MWVRKGPRPVWCWPGGCGVGRVKTSPRQRKKHGGVNEEFKILIVHCTTLDVLLISKDIYIVRLNLPCDSISSYI